MGSWWDGLYGWLWPWLLALGCVPVAIDAYAGHCMFSGFVLTLAVCCHCIAASRITV